MNHIHNRCIKIHDKITIKGRYYPIHEIFPVHISYGESFVFILRNRLLLIP